MKQLLLFILAAIVFGFVLTGCGDNEVVLASIAVSPPATEGIIPGPTVTFTATGTYSDGSTSQTVAGLAWSSSDTNIATIGASTGVATCANTGGPITITATAPISPGSSTTVSGTAQLTCVAPA